MQVKIGKISLIISLLLLFLPVTYAASGICDQGCVKNLDQCPSDASFLCKRSLWWDKCVVRGFDFGSCGSPSEDSGYCMECDLGCSLNEKECGSNGYLCKKSWALDECVEEGYDFGCCGGLSSEGKEEVTVLTWRITNNDPKCKDKYPVKWEVKRRGESQFKDYTDKCYENTDEAKYSNTPISIPVGESREVTCRSKFIPHTDTGPHKARISWCSHSNVSSYGDVPSSGKYCVINVTADGDNVHELNADALVFTLGERLTEIRRGVVGSATIGPYDPIYEVGHTEPSLVPIQDIKPARECLSNCPDCSVIFDLQVDISGDNHQSSRCPVSAFMQGAYTGAIFLMSDANDGRGVDPSGEIEYNEDFYMDTRMKKGVEYAPGIKVPHEVGEEIYEKGYASEKAVNRMKMKELKLREKYKLSPQLTVRHSGVISDEMANAFTRNPVMQENFINLVKDQAHKKLLEAGVPSGKVDEVLTDEMVGSMVKGFYRDGQVIFPKKDEELISNYKLVTGKSSVPKEVKRVGSNTFAEVLVNDMELFDGKTLKNFIGENTFGMQTEQFIEVNFQRMNLDGSAKDNVITLNKENRFLSETAMFHEVGHVIGYEKTDNKLPHGAIQEVMATKAEVEFYEKMNKLYPGRGYDLAAVQNRRLLYDNPAYGASLGFWDYYKHEEGFDILKDEQRFQDFLKMTDEESTLQVTAKWRGLQPGLKNAMEEGGQKLSNKLRFDSKKEKYVWVGKGMRRTKRVAKIAKRSLFVGLSIVGVLGDIDTALGGAMGIYKSEQNPLTQQVVSIDYVKRDGSRGTGCGTMVVSEDDHERYVLPSSFTLSKGYLWDIHLGSREGDRITSSDMEGLRLEGIGVELDPTYKDCEKDGSQLTCQDSDKTVSSSGGDRIFPSGNTGYVCTKPLEQEGACGS